MLRDKEVLFTLVLLLSNFVGAHRGKWKHSHEENKVLIESQNERITNIEKNLDKKIMDFQATQNDQNLKLQDNINNDLETLKTEIKSQNQTISEVFEALTEKVEAQDQKIMELQNNLDTELESLKKTIDNKESELSMKLELTDNLNKGLAVLEKKFQQAYDALNAKMYNELQISKNEVRTDCYKILEDKCSEETCSTF